MSIDSEPRPADVDEVVDRVRDWPREKKLVLLRALLGLAEPARQPPRTTGLASLRGLIDPGGRPPTDEEIEEIRWQAHLERHGRS